MHRQKRLKDVDKVIKQLDATIRAEAFKLLEPWVSDSEVPSSPKKKKAKNPGDRKAVSAAELLKKVEAKTPADRLLLTVACHYTTYGNEPFSVPELKETAKAQGLTRVPDRADMTLKQKKFNGKGIVAAPSDGRFSLTVAGEEWVQQTYNVRAGTQKKTPKGDE